MRSGSVPIGLCPSNRARPFAAAFHIVAVLNLEDFQAHFEPEVPEDDLVGFVCDVSTTVEIEVPVPLSGVWSP